MSDKERLELLNLRKRVQAQREEINRLQRRGTWIEKFDQNEHPIFRHKWYCSACGGWNTNGASAYCPKCGARMMNTVAGKLDELNDFKKGDDNARQIP